MKFVFCRLAGIVVLLVLLPLIAAPASAHGGDATVVGEVNLAPVLSGNLQSSHIEHDSSSQAWECDGSGLCYCTLSPFDLPMPVEVEAALPDCGAPVLLSGQILTPPYPPPD